MLHVSLLGEQAITDGRGESVRARSSRAVVLIAFLVVHAGSPQPRQRIAGLFWPESTDGQALTNLRRELHHLRHLLGDESSLVVTPCRDRFYSYQRVLVRSHRQLELLRLGFGGGHFLKRI